MKTFELTINGVKCDASIKEQLPLAPKSSLNRNAVPVLMPVAPSCSRSISDIMPKIPYSFTIELLDAETCCTGDFAPPQEASAPKPVAQFTKPAAPAAPLAPAPAPAMAPSSAAGGEEITAPMPGTILSIHVAPGARVKEGDLLLVFEAMKMQNELIAPRDGTIISVNVSPNATIDTGTLLCVLA